MRILVTGSKGVVGQKLAKVLEARGHEVFGIDLQHSPGEVGFIQKMSHEKWVYSRCDISEYRQLERLLDEAGPFDMIYNCAAEFGRWNGEDYYEQVWRTNVIGLKHILRLQEKLQFKLVHFSSSEVYGDYEEVMREDVMDTHEVKQMNDYALSKWTNEVQIGNSAALHQTKSVIVRLFNTYGPGEYYHPYRSVNCKFCYHALMGLPVDVFKGHYRSSTYIDDCVETLANISANFIPGSVYNIGSDQYHAIETLAELIWDYSGASKSLISYGESEMLTTKTKKVDISNSLRDLKHRSTVDLKEGVKRTIDWMREYYKL
jgi:dTDP-glucose 4,6-dehydratase